MGSFHSIPSRSERRRTNRLSKPFTNKAYSSPISPKSSAASSHVSSPVTSSPPTWKDPWSGNSIPINSPVSGCHGSLPQSLPPVESQPDGTYDSVSLPVVIRVFACCSPLSTTEQGHISFPGYFRTFSECELLGDRRGGFSTSNNNNNNAIDRRSQRMVRQQWSWRPNE